MDELQNEFNSAAEHVQFSANQSAVAQSDLLILYGLYKQATCEGEFEKTARPGFFEFKAKEKYNAWASVAQLDGATAKRQYIENVRRIFPKYCYDPAIRSTNSLNKTVSRMVCQDTPDELHVFLAQDRLK